MPRKHFESGDVLLADELEGAFLDLESQIGDGGGSGHTIQNAAGVALPQQSGLQFVGATVSDDAANGRTIVTVPGVADGSITTAKIADGAVTAAKLSSIYINSVQAQINDLPTIEEVEEFAHEAAQDAFEAGENITFTPDGATGKIAIRATGNLAATLARAAVSVTTSNLANGATDSSKVVTLGRAAWVLRAATSAPAWVRLYSSAAAQASDAARLISEFPIPGSGILLDVVTTPGHLSIDLAPMAQVANLEAIPSTDYHVTVKNLSGAAQNITVTLTKLTIEI